MPRNGSGKYKKPPIETPKQRAIRKLGGVQKTANALGIKRSAIYQWDKIPLERVKQLSELTGISRARLRPDYFGRG